MGSILCFSAEPKKNKDWPDKIASDFSWIIYQSPNEACTGDDHDESVDLKTIICSKGFRLAIDIRWFKKQPRLYLDIKPDSLGGVSLGMLLQQIYTFLNDPIPLDLKSSVEEENMVISGSRKMGITETNLDFSQGREYFEITKLRDALGDSVCYEGLYLVYPGEYELRLGS